MSNTQPLKCDKEILLPQPWPQPWSAMAAEVTAQAIERAKLVDSPLLECSTLRVNDLVDE